MSKNNIATLKKFLEGAIREKVIEEILIDAGEKVQADIKSLAPEDTGKYKSSILLSEVQHNGSNHRIKIYTNLNSGWKNVPLGCLLEWGTGIQGEKTNTYDHGFPYRSTPWVYYNERYGRWIFTTGNIARPHFIPGLYNNQSYFEKAIKRRIGK